MKITLLDSIIFFKERLLAEGAKLKIVNLIILVFVIASCSTPQKIIDNNLSSKEILSEITKLRLSYIGENVNLENISLYVKELENRNEFSYETLIAKSWVTLRNGYINENLGHTRKSLEESYKILIAAINLNNKRWEAWKDLTHFYIKVNNIEAAKQSFEQFNKLTLFHDDKSYLYNKSLIVMNLNNLEKNYNLNQKEYENCSKYSSNKYEKKNCLHDLGLSYEKSKQYKKLIELRKYVLKMFPNNAWSTGNLASAYYLNKNFDEAIELYKKAIEIRPYGLAKANLSFLYFYKLYKNYEQGNIEEAKRFLKLALELNYYDEYGSSYAVSVLSKTFKNKSDIEKILFSSEKQIPSSAIIKSNIAWYYFQEEDYQKAKKYYAESLADERIRFQPRDNVVFAALQIGLIDLWRSDKKEYDSAIQWLTKASPFLDSKSLYAGKFYYYLGSAYHDKSWIEKNIKLSEMALENYKKSLNFSGINHTTVKKNIRAVEVNIRNFRKI